MKIIGCDLHARQQTLAMLDAATGEVVKRTLKREGSSVREFYSSLTRPVRVDTRIVFYLVAIRLRRSISRNT